MFKLEYNVIYIKENLCITYIFFYWIDCLYCPCIVSFELVQWPALIFAANLQPFFPCHQRASRSPLILCPSPSPPPSNFNLNLNHAQPEFYRGIGAILLQFARQKS